MAFGVVSMSPHGHLLLTDQFSPPPPFPTPPFLPAQQSRRAGRPRLSCGKQVLSCQSGARLEQEPTGLNRRERIPSQPLIYIRYTLHPPQFAQQLRSPPAEGGREGRRGADRLLPRPLRGRYRCVCGGRWGRDWRQGVPPSERGFPPAPAPQGSARSPHPGEAVGVGCVCRGGRGGWGVALPAHADCAGRRTCSPHRPAANGSSNQRLVSP